MVHPLIQSLAAAAESFCGRWMQNDNHKSLLVIVGNFGSGKTHTAKAIYRFANAASLAAFETKKWGHKNIPSSIFISWPEAANKFGERNFAIMDSALEDDLVVLDDVGAENDPWKICADRLCQILSKREKKFTVVTTNLQPSEWPERLDGRIADRLLRNSIVVDLTGVPSYSIR